MKRGTLLGAGFGLIATLFLWARPVVLEGYGIDILLAQPELLLTDIVWTVLLTALAGGLAERSGVILGDPTERSETAAGVDDGMREIDP